MRKRLDKDNLNRLIGPDEQLLSRCHDFGIMATDLWPTSQMRSALADYFEGRDERFVDCSRRKVAVQA
jgi:hypothetical protein